MLPHLNRVRRQPYPSTSALLLALALSVSVNASASAQLTESKKAKKDVIIVALVADSLVPDATATITRHRKGNLPDVIFLRRSTATSGGLERAIRELVTSHKTKGHKIDKILQIRMHDRSKASTDPATIDLFNKLLSAPPHPIPGAGNVPAVAVYVDSDHKK